MNRFEQLWPGYMNGTLTVPELEEFLALLHANEPVTGHHLDGLLEERLTGYALPNEKELIYQKLRQVMQPQRSSVTIHRVHLLKTAWFRYAAAILLVLSGFFIYYYFSDQFSSGNVIVKNRQPVSLPIMPGTDRAVLTLSNGERIPLNNASSETIFDGTLSIKNNNGQLYYQHSNVLAVNTMTTPRGGQYRLTLADGTRVWLNAASSITFPTVFKGSTREVSVSGEVYFEVAKDAAQPFIVKTISDNIEVLGTSFNINGYADEQYMKTSVLSGAVKINNLVLKPGQALQNGKLIITDVQQDIAWKNGFFNFNNADLASVLRQIGRWYDVDIKYQGNVNKSQKFKGKVQRSLPLTDVLDILEKIVVHFIAEGKTIIVLP